MPPPGIVERPVFTVTGLDLKSADRHIIKELGGVFRGDWSAEVTHLLADTFRRTVKLMCAVCTGARIVTPDYLRACREAGRFVDDRQFALQDAVCERAFARKHHLMGGFTLDEALERRHTSGPLLKGVSVYCFPSVVEKHDLPHVVAAAGGTWLERFPKPEQNPVLLLAEREVSGKEEQQSRKKYKVYDVELLREAACTQVLRKKAWRLS